MTVISIETYLSEVAIMKSTGIVREVDPLGRYVLPVELRRKLDIKVREPLEIYYTPDSIMLKKHQPCCLFCNEGRNTVHFKGKIVCKKCVDDIVNMETDSGEQG